jgi:hypothetical protein
MSIAKPLSLSTNFFQLNLFIFQHFNDLFFGKQILLTNYIFSLNKNHFDLKLDIYYRQKKLIFYRKLKLKKKQEKKDLRAIYSIVKNLKLLLGTNCFSVHFRVLNKRVVYLAFFKPLKKKFKYFKKVLFQRRFGLLTDILKISILYFTHQILLQPLVNLIGELLQRLSKKKHGVFLRFVKILLNDGFLSLRKPKIYDKLYGCKFRISGKIRGKLRAKNISLIFGSIPISTFSKNIESGFTNVYTIYGVFGLKLWMCVGISPKKNFDKIIKRIFLFKEYLKKIKKIKNKKKLNHKKTIKKENSKKKTIKKKN